MTAEFELLEDFTIFIALFGFEFEYGSVKITSDGFLTIKKGFRWGASGPTFDTKSSRRASCAHDALYYLSDWGLFLGRHSKDMRQFSDDLLYKMCIQDGMWKFRAKAWLKSLEIFGGLAWESDN